jgi:alpha-ribazole phosphatase
MQVAAGVRHGRDWSQMITIILIRHGQIPGNITRAYAGCRTDQLLTEKGVRQSAELRLPAVDRVLVSPMTRCRQTAEIAFPGMAHEVVEDLREMDFGIFEGKSAAEMEDCAEYRAWVDSRCENKIPGGESNGEFAGRVMRAFEEALARCADGERIALVVHGGTIMSIMGAYNDEGRHAFEYNLGNCEYYVCECELPAAGEAPVLHRIGGIEPRGHYPSEPDGE